MPQTPQLVYLAFGAETYQREAVFSIVSALSHTLAGQPPTFAIQVFTDTPALYTRLPVTTHAIDPSWNGPHGYHFRIKHVVLQKVLEANDKAVLIDTDTFFRSSAEELFQRVTPGSLLCNAIGSPLAQAQPLNNALLARLQTLGLADPGLRQTNSGVIGLHNSDKALLGRSIQLMDELRPLAPELYTLEELCLALAAHRHLKLRECTDVIHHYWSRKAQFRAKINAWYQKHQHAPLSPQAMADVRLINDRLPRTPQPRRAWQKLATALGPGTYRQFFRELLYGCQQYENEFDQACSTVWWDKALENLESRQKPSVHEIRKALASPLLKWLAGEHYLSMHTYLLAKLNEPISADTAHHAE
ncbi:hypothetical protein DZC76_02575 [Pseudomonas sp. phDV1]|nr:MULTISPECIES: hypothetical protein [Pseudomonas]AXO60324.1 hypothetical protein DZC76_02575 [Pseudomonas sp. phDV1]TXR40081.1 hypothetical protein FVE88_06175 [Pseudomonas mendocina]